jgi:hypothetical protein
VRPITFDDKVVRTNAWHWLRADLIGWYVIAEMERRLSRARVQIHTRCMLLSNLIDFSDAHVGEGLCWRVGPQVSTPSALTTTSSGFACTPLMKLLGEGA